jgi:hypothetical protein
MGLLSIFFLRVAFDFPAVAVCSRLRIFRVVSPAGADLSNGLVGCNGRRGNALFDAGVKY